MSKHSPYGHIGFPPPLLGEQALRLPLAGKGKDWVCLEKPAGVAMREYPWDPAVKDLDSALNKQLLVGKPELLRLEASVFGSVYYLDPEISGLGLFAKNREGLAHLRNQFGSADMQFRFLFVAPVFEGDLEEGFQADAPLLPHNTKPKMIPSTAKGKKASTLFHRIAVSGGWALWEAKVDFFRPHQVRAHFALSGVSILGDPVYGEIEVPILRDFVRKKRSGGSGLNVPVFEGLALHLDSLSFNEMNGVGVSLRSNLPRQFSVLLHRMGLSDTTR